MANTYTQLYIHVVFAVKYREALINSSFKEELHKYIAGILANKQHKLLAIHAMPDHLHLFIGMNPDVSLSSLVKEIKTQSTNFINTKKLTKSHFRWQTGYGAFSYARSQKKVVINYILKQQEHHRKKSFREEHITSLKLFEIEFHKKFLFEFLCD